MGCSSSTPIMSSFAFDKKVENARRDIGIGTTTFSSSQQQQYNIEHQHRHQQEEESNQQEQEPYSGQYIMWYVDRNRTKNSMSNLSFSAVTMATNGNNNQSDNNNMAAAHVKIAKCIGYKISGRKVDVDGKSVVEDGFVNAKNGKAWWVEQFMSGNDIGVRVLSVGVFHFKDQAFVGKWQSSAGYRGKYTSFDANLPLTTTEISTDNSTDDDGNDDSDTESTFAVGELVPDELSSSSQLQQQQQQYQDYIPIVMAKAEEGILFNSMKKPKKVVGRRNNTTTFDNMYYSNVSRNR